MGEFRWLPALRTICASGDITVLNTLTATLLDSIEGYQKPPDQMERGEDYLKDKFETALGKADLSFAARSAVEQAWTSVKASHDQMRDLKHGLH